LFLDLTKSLKILYCAFEIYRISTLIPFLELVPKPLISVLIGLGLKTITFPRGDQLAHSRLA